MKPKSLVVAALALVAVLVSAEFSAVTGRVARTLDTLATRNHARAAANATTTAAKILVRTLVCAAKS
jgi:hypothetical protein